MSKDPGKTGDPASMSSQQESKTSSFHMEKAMIGKGGTSHFIHVDKQWPPTQWGLHLLSSRLWRAEVAWWLPCWGCLLCPSMLVVIGEAFHTSDANQFSRLVGRVRSGGYRKCQTHGAGLFHHWIWGVAHFHHPPVKQGSTHMAHTHMVNSNFSGYRRAADGLADLSSVLASGSFGNCNQ